MTDSDPPIQGRPSQGPAEPVSSLSSTAPVAHSPTPAGAAIDGHAPGTKRKSPGEPGGPQLPHDPLADDKPVIEEDQSISHTVRTVLIGKKHDLADSSIFHNLSLVAFLAWVGLGADGLSSSCYGPAEAFKMLQEGGQDFRFLAVFLALATAATVFIISACYSHIIEVFPSGGGGYVVATKLLGKHVGLLSGCALLVDYALTVTVSIAAAGDSLWGLLKPGAPLEALGFPLVLESKIYAEMAVIVLMIVLNLRGVKESVMALLPIFMLFLVTHAILIVGAVTLKLSAMGAVVDHVIGGVQTNLANPDVGLVGMVMIFLHAYSMGAGTYTGLEAVSNSMPVMREPRVATGKKTMMYMAVSLALTAGGLMLAYLLLDLHWSEEPTMNHILSQEFVETLGLPRWLGTPFVLLAVASEGCLLFVAAQAGFIDGPRVLANMARDSWAPHWFTDLSERLAAHNGVLLMGLAALAALWSTGGDVLALVTMYSINVFVTFSLSMIAMVRHWHGERHNSRLWLRRLLLFAFGGAMCIGILIVTVYEKFEVGGYKTIVVTLACFLVCLSTNRYYRGVTDKLKRLNSLMDVAAPPGTPVVKEPDPHAPTCAVLVGGFSGLGIHTVLNALRFGPGQFSNVAFITVGVVDSGNFKGADAVEDLKRHTEHALNQYVDYARRIGLPAIGFMAIGADPVEELERLCVEVKQRFPRSVFFAGQLVFQRDTWYRRVMHNGTAFALQRRLQWDNMPIVILPTRVR